MASQLQGSPRRLQPTSEELKKQCISRVTSENLVSPLRFTGQSDLTHGFITHNEPDTLDVITKFVSHEKDLPSPGALRRDVQSRLHEAKGKLYYQFPEELVADRYLLMECPSVSVEQCATNQYAVKFGYGFADSGLCSKIHHPALPIRKLLFELECISHCNGLKAISESASARALHTYFSESTDVVSSCDNCSLDLEYKETSYSSMIHVFEFVCPATVQTQRTAHGLLVMPHSEIYSPYQSHIVSISITPNPHGSLNPPEAIQEGLDHVSSLLRRGVEKLFGRNSPDKLLSVSSFID